MLSAVKLNFKSKTQDFLVDIIKSNKSNFSSLNKLDYICRKNLIKQKNNNSDSFYICEKTKNEFNIKNKTNHKVISAWHDIDLVNKATNNTEDESYNVCIEIPFSESKKLELSKDLPYNPIIQDMKKSKSGDNYFRYIKLPYNTNYGFLPQTWEDNTKEYFDGFKGDDDPIDVLEISWNRFHVGSVVKVKVLGSFCLIDQGEIDYKVIVINTNFLESNNLKADDFFEKWKKKGELNRLINVFKTYKTLEGKKENFIYKNKIYNKEETKEIISEGHKIYLKNKQYLIERANKNI